MSAASVNSDDRAESTSGSSKNESSERKHKRKETIRIGSPSSPYAKIVAVDEDAEEPGVGVGATEESAAGEADGTDEKGSGKNREESVGEEEDAEVGGKNVLTEDGKKRRVDAEKVATAYGKRKEEEEEEERKNEERKRVMKEEQWAEERMKEIREEEEVEVRVRAVAEEMKQGEVWAAFEEKRTRGEGMRKETIDLREARVTWGRGLVDVEKPGEKKREEDKREERMS